MAKGHSVARGIRDGSGSAMRPVVALDIDGTLGDHYTHFAQFAALWLGRDVKYDPSLGWEGSDRFNFSRSLSISKATYRKIKLAYRLGGMKRSMPVFEGASELTIALAKYAQIWICTTRPYLRLDTMDPDTRHWLTRNHIRFHNVIYGDYKYHELSRIVGKTNVVAVLDDLTELYDQAARAGLPPVLIERPHNADRPANRYETVGDLWEAQDVILKLVRGYGAK